MTPEARGQGSERGFSGCETAKGFFRQSLARWRAGKKSVFGVDGCRQVVSCFSLEGDLYKNPLLWTHAAAESRFG